MTRLRMRDPWLVACWPGMGSVALLAGMHLAKSLKAQGLEELPTNGFLDVRVLLLAEKEHGTCAPVHLYIGTQMPSPAS